MSQAPSPGVVGSRFETTPLRFRNVHQELLNGVLVSKPHSTAQTCAIVLHGMLMHKDSLFYPSLTDSLLNSCPEIHRVYRFDFSGHGGSEGTFQYGAYSKMVSEIHSATLMLQHNGLRPTHLIGHSMAANAVLLFATLYTHIPHVVALSPRFDMMVDSRFTKEQLMKLIRDGTLIWHVRDKEIPISLETYQERLRTDMTQVRRIRASDSVHTLLIHGTADEVIPFNDACCIHQWMTTGADLHGEMDALDTDSMFRLTPSPMSSTPVTHASFDPPLALRQNTFIPLVGANHNFSNLCSSETMAQAIALWTNSHVGQLMEAMKRKFEIRPDGYAMQVIKNRQQPQLQPNGIQPQLLPPSRVASISQPHIAALPSSSPTSPRSYSHSSSHGSVSVSPQSPSPALPAPPSAAASSSSSVAPSSNVKSPPFSLFATLPLPLPLPPPPYTPPSSSVLTVALRSVERDFCTIVYHAAPENMFRASDMQVVLEKIQATPSNSSEYVKLLRVHLTTPHPSHGTAAVLLTRFLFLGLLRASQPRNRHPLLDGIAHEVWLKQYFLKPLPRTVRKPNVRGVFDKLFGETHAAMNPSELAYSRATPETIRRWTVIKRALQDWSKEQAFPSFKHLYDKLKSDGCTFEEDVPLHLQQPSASASSSSSSHLHHQQLQHHPHQQHLSVQPPNMRTLSPMGPPLAIMPMPVPMQMQPMQPMMPMPMPMQAPHRDASYSSPPPVSSRSPVQELLSDRDSFERGLAAMHHRLLFARSDRSRISIDPCLRDLMVLDGIIHTLVQSPTPWGSNEDDMRRLIEMNEELEHFTEEDHESIKLAQLEKSQRHLQQQREYQLQHQQQHYDELNPLHDDAYGLPPLPIISLSLSRQCSNEETEPGCEMPKPTIVAASAISSASSSSSIPPQPTIGMDIEASAPALSPSSFDPPPSVSLPVSVPPPTLPLPLLAPVAILPSVLSVPPSEDPRQVLPNEIGLNSTPAECDINIINENENENEVVLIEQSQQPCKDIENEKFDPALSVEMIRPPLHDDIGSLPSVLVIPSLDGEVDEPAELVYAGAPPPLADDIDDGDVAEEGNLVDQPDESQPVEVKLPRKVRMTKPQQQQQKQLAPCI